MNIYTYIYISSYVYICMYITLTYKTQICGRATTIVKASGSRQQFQLQSLNGQKSFTHAHSEFLLIQQPMRLLDAGKGIQYK